MQQIPGLSVLIRAFWEAIEKGQFDEAASILQQAKGLVARYVSTTRPFAELARMEKALEAAMDDSGVVPVIKEGVKEVVKDGVRIGEVSEFVNAIGWLIVILFILYLVTHRAYAEENRQQDGKSGNTVKKKLSELLPSHRPDVNPAAELNQRARPALDEYAKWRRKHCDCSRPQSAALGPGFAGQQLAFGALAPDFPTGGNAGAGRGPFSAKPGGAAPATSGGAGVDPFSFPKPGGVRLPLPGRGQPSPSLPDARPRGPCFWPLCKQAGDIGRA
jgi:hypothetical protein